MTQLRAYFTEEACTSVLMAHVVSLRIMLERTSHLCNPFEISLVRFDV